MEYLENERRYFQGIHALLTEIMNYRTLHIWQLNLHLCLLPNGITYWKTIRKIYLYFPLTLLQRNRLASSSVKGEVIKVSHIKWSIFNNQ
jgi:hypothetical protein